MKKLILLVSMASISYTNPYFDQVDIANNYAKNRTLEAQKMIDLYWNPERDKATLERNEAAKPKTAEECAIYAFNTEWCTMTYPKERQLYYDRMACKAVTAGCIVAKDATYCKLYEKHKCTRFVKEPK